MYLSNKDSFVIYRYPNSHNLHLIIGKWEDLKFDCTLNSFIFSPFNGIIQKINGEKNILKEDIIISNNAHYNSKTLAKDEYLNIANDFISLCKNKAIDKVVLSRVVKEKNNIENIYHLFKKLCNSYDKTFNYVLNHPKYGMWMGASPELLIKGDSTSHFESVALAGSKIWNDKIIWNTKEIEEQQYVKIYIENVLQKHTHQLQCIKNLETIKAGNIAHLKSTFQFKLKSSIIECIKELHPTPAVCGIPVEITKNYIQKNEVHERELYTGYIGEVNLDSASLYVNLRCMKITSDQFYVYVGGGLTAKSNAKQEWEETEIKAQTMLSLIKNS